MRLFNRPSLSRKFRVACEVDRIRRDDFVVVGLELDFARN